MPSDSMAATNGAPLEAAPSRYAAFEGARVHYKLLGGAGPATILVHGGGCDLTFWILQVPALADSGRVLLLDLPGHGRSDPFESGPYSMKRYAGAVAAVMDDAGIDRALVVGHSLGVPTLREFYRAHPERVAGFVAIDGVLVYEDPTWMQPLMARIDADATYQEAWSEMVDAYTLPTTPEWAREKVGASMKRAPRQIVRSFFPEMFHPDTAVNDAIAVPLLGLFAGDDNWSSSYLERARRVADDAELVVMSGCSHFLMLDRPDEVNDHLLTFRTRVFEEVLSP